jgi:hypothetical protein
MTRACRCDPFALALEDSDHDAPPVSSYPREVLHAKVTDDTRLFDGSRTGSILKNDRMQRGFSESIADC